MNDSQYYFYDNRIVERHDYTFEGKEYVASDGTSICFSVGSSWVNYEDITDVGERIVDVYYQGGIQIYCSFGVMTTILSYKAQGSIYRIWTA